MTRHHKRLFVALVASAFVFGAVSAASAEPLSNTASRTVGELQARWAANQPFYTGAPFRVAPSVAAPHSTGELAPSFVQDGLKRLNFARFLVGLPDDVTVNSAYSDSIQHGAVVLAAGNSGLTHHPAKPAGMSQSFYDAGYSGTSSSNLAVTDSLRGSIDQYLGDSDPSNIAALGHRRWVLNPPLRETGFGFARPNGGYGGYGYSGMYVFDWGRTDAVTYSHYGWPAAGAFPLAFLPEGTPWSVHLDPNVYDYNWAGIVVTLTRVSDGASWRFDYADRPVVGKPWSGEYYNFNDDGYGDPVCIVFRPGLNMHYRYGDSFDVRVSGDLYREGTDNRVEIKYRTAFCRLVPTLPHTYVSTPIARGTMSRHRYYGVRGYLKPRHTAGTYPVRIYKWKKRASGSWKSYGYVRAKASDYSAFTKYTRSVRLPSAGRWRLRAYTPADDGHSATWSSGYDYVTVR